MELGVIADVAAEVAVEVGSGVATGVAVDSGPGLVGPGSTCGAAQAATITSAIAPAKATVGLIDELMVEAPGESAQLRRSRLARVPSG
jgi:hypothetical protein